MLQPAPHEESLHERMQEKLFNDDVLPMLVEQIHRHIKDPLKTIDAIARGFDQPSFLARVQELELAKQRLENLQI